MSLIVQVTKKILCFISTKKSDKSSAVEFSSTKCCSISDWNCIFEIESFFSTLKMRSNLIPFIFWWKSIFGFFSKCQTVPQNCYAQLTKISNFMFLRRKKTKTGTNSVMFETCVFVTTLLKYSDRRFKHSSQYDNSNSNLKML